MSGFDLFRLKQVVEKPDPKTAQAAANDALRSGATSFDRLEIVANIAHGDLELDTGSLTGAAGEAHVTGGMHLASRTLDVWIVLQPALPSPPEVSIALDRPDRSAEAGLPELADLARWMAALVH